MDWDKQRVSPVIRVLIGQGAISAASFLTVLAVGRWQGAAELGIYSLGLSFWYLALSLGDTLVLTPYTYFVAQRDRPVIDLPVVALAGIIILATLFAIVLTFLRWLGDLLPQGLDTLWPSLPFALAAGSLRELVRRHLLATRQAALLLPLDVCSALSQLAGIGVLQAVHKLSASNVYWVTAVTSLACLTPFFRGRSLFLRIRTAGRQFIPGLKGFLAYGHWLLLGGLCHVASTQAYPWLAYAAGGERVAGLFASCNALVNVLSPVLTGLVNYFRPMFMFAQAQSNRGRFVRYVLQRVPVFALPGALLVAIVFFYGDFFLIRLYGPSYGAGAEALRWLALGMLGIATAAPLQLALLALGASVTNLYYHGMGLFLLAVGAWYGFESLALDGLGRLFGTVNLVSAAVLAILFAVYATAKPPAPPRIDSGESA